MKKMNKGESMNQKNILFILGIIIPIIIMAIAVPPLLKVKENKEPTKIVSLMEMEPYKNLKMEDVIEIEKLRYTEGGMEPITITDKDEINKTLYYLLNMKLGDETERACEDNTTVYVIKTNDEKEIKVEIECDWVIISGKRYLIVK